MLKPLRIGLALSGGTAKSVGHVGAIKALHEQCIKIDCVAGTSGGAIAAAAYCAGLSIDEMEMAANELNWGKLTSLKLSPLGFVSSKRIEEYMIEQFGGDIEFSDLKIPCAVTGTDLDTGLKFIFKSGKVANAVRISCSLPHFFLPVEHDQKVLIDGGLSEYLPIQTARELGADFVIGVNLGDQNVEYKKPKHILQLFMQVNNLVAKQNMRASAGRADYLITPDLTGFGAFDFNNSEKLIQLLYQSTCEVIDEIKQTYYKKNRLLSTYRLRKIWR